MSLAAERRFELELRCPFGTRRLFSKMEIGEVFLAFVRAYGRPEIMADNLIGFSCPDCRRRLRVEERRDVGRIIHKFNLLGELVESVEDPL